MGRGGLALQFTPHFFDTLPSTQILARRWVESKKYQSGDLIIAAQQTESYGRRGHAWMSPKGNFSGTFILDLKSQNDLKFLPFAMCLAIYDAAARYTKEPLGIKWPNDVLLNGAKLAGMMIEVVDKAALIGVGVNLAYAPESDQKTASLTACPTPDEFTAQLLPRFAHWYDLGIAGGVAAMRGPWLEHAIHQRNQAIRARLGDGTMVEGKFIDLDPDGALLLETPQQTHVITSADIFS
jgi:BirA family biotin operon repressor/biotin-[acetyl-CoA-carboxylase] ligase